MITTIKTFGHMIENYSNQFWLIDLNTQSISLKAASSVDIAIIKA
jgi:hypothetical protein